nr:hypothetical protein [Tanacetum cinerariifolium]
MASDDIEQAIDDVANDSDQPPNDSTQTKDKSSKQDWFRQPPRPPTPYSEWNKRQVVVNQPEQPWFNQTVFATKDPLSFDELMATPIDFSNIKLEYNMEECFKELIDRLDYNNPEGDRYPLDLTKPLPLKGHPGRLTVVADYFFNKDLEFLKSSDLKKKYTMSITKTKAAQYEIVGIKYMVPTLWSATKFVYNKDAKRGSSTGNILSMVCVSVKKLHSYGHMEEITMRKANHQVYKFKEGDFVDLHLNDVEDMLLLAVQHKLFQLDGSDIVDLIMGLCIFTRSLAIKRRVEDLQLGVESYQTKLNITEPQKTFSGIKFKELYTLSYKPPGIQQGDVYEKVDGYRQKEFRAYGRTR